MDQETEYLKNFPLFSKVPLERIESAALLWETKALKKDEQLWWQGAPADDFAFIITGSLQIHINQKHLATVKQGEMIGEVAAFTQDSRTASITAAEDSVLLMLPVSHLETLKESHPLLYGTILDACLTRMASRVQEMGKKIASKAQGDASVPTRKSESALGKFWKRLTGAGNQTPPSIGPAIRKLPRFKNASRDIHLQVTGAMTPHFVKKGDPIFLEADPGDSVFLVVEGCVDVLRNVRGGKAQRLATLVPGALFGTGSLLLRARRNASCVASKNTDCWVFELDSQAHKSLLGQAGQLWRECLIAALAFQLRNADDRLVALMSGGIPSMTDYDKIRGGLAAFQGE